MPTAHAPALTEPISRLEAAAPAEPLLTPHTGFGRLGIWEWQLSSREFYLSPTLRDILGYHEESADTLCDVEQMVHPDDRPALESRIHAVMSGRSTVLSSRHRMLHHDGSVRWVLVRATVLQNDAGHPSRLLGICADITVRLHPADRRDIALCVGGRC